MSGQTIRNFSPPSRHQIAFSFNSDRFRPIRQSQKDGRRTEKLGGKLARMFPQIKRENHQNEVSNSDKKFAS